MTQDIFSLPLLQDPMGGLQGLLPIILIFFIMYFLLIRPQNKERKAQQLMRSQLEKGQKVLTQGGIVATVSLVKEREVVLQLDGAKITVARDAIVSNLKDEEAKG